jgi:hypothetical protein
MSSSLYRRWWTSFPTQAHSDIPKAPYIKLGFNNRSIVDFTFFQKISLRNAGHKTTVNRYLEGALRDVLKITSYLL